MDINHLSAEDRAELLRQFRLACMHRAAQWDAERGMELILGCDIDLDIADFAFAIDMPTEEEAARVISEQALIDALKAA